MKGSGYKADLYIQSRQCHDEPRVTKLYFCSFWSFVLQLFHFLQSSGKGFMDRYGNRWKDNHMDLSELKLYCIGACGCRKQILIALVNPSKVLSGFC